MAHTEGFTLNIPLKKHLKEFVVNHYGIGYRLSLHNSLGLMIYQILRRRKFRSDRCYHDIEYEESFSIYISKSYAFDKGCRILDPYQVYLINSYLDSILMDQCHIYLDARMEHDTNLKQFIYDWLNRYNISTGSKDWYHKIKKSYRRYREKVGKNIKNSPSRMSPENRKHNITFKPSCSAT